MNNFVPENEILGNQPIGICLHCIRKLFLVNHSNHVNPTPSMYLIWISLIFRVLNPNNMSIFCQAYHISILKIKRSVPIVISDSYLLHIFCTNMYSAIVLWKQKKILLFLQCVVFPFQKNDPCIDRSEYDTNDVSYILVTKQTFLLYIVEVLRGKVQWVILPPS